MKIIKEGKTLEQLDEESRTIECEKCKRMVRGRGGVIV